MDSHAKQVYQLICNNSFHKIFIVRDFLHISNHNNITKILNRLYSDKKINRIANGIYSRLDFEIGKNGISAETYALTLARTIALKFNYRCYYIFPQTHKLITELSGIKLVEDPNQFLFATIDSPSTHHIGGISLTFKHINYKNYTDLSPVTNNLLFVLMTLPKLTLEAIERLNAMITDRQIDELTGVMLDCTQVLSNRIKQVLKAKY